MSKSSMHIRPVTIGSERHNQRQQKLNYVREDLIQENSSFIHASIAETRAAIEARYQESRGQKMQAKSTPIREGVLLIEKHHTANDLKALGDKLEKRFGIKTIQAYAHKDEGHYDKETSEWKPNYHGHMVFDWTDEKGKSIKLNREDMGEMQTLVANHLQMERGQPSTKKHIESREFKALKVEEDIKKLIWLEKTLPAAFSLAKQAESLGKDVEALKATKKELQQEADLTKLNLDYLNHKTDQKREELKELEKEVNKKQSQQFKR